MSRRLIFITHAEVLIDPNVPVPDWPLNDVGRARHQAFSNSDYLVGVSVVYSSAERKAMDGAEILGAARGVPHRVEADLHENDRSATGYLPPEEFEHTADLFFANPQQSIRGWERAIDAQARVMTALRRIVQQEPTGDIAIVAHGGVGTLSLCQLKGEPISRTGDQAKGGGSCYAVRLPDWQVLHGWRNIDAPLDPMETK